MTAPAVPGVELLGRDTELAALAGALDTARDHAGVLFLVGEPGIGKSSLLQAAVSRGRGSGYRILGTAGVEAEAELPFAGLHQLLRPVQDRLDGLPVVQRDALRSAFGLADGGAPDPYLIASAVLALLTSAARDRPLVLALDDVHWLDGPTDEILALVLPQLSAQPVVVLGTARHGYRSRLLDSGLLTLEVRGLGEAAAHQLLDEHADGLDQGARAQILHQSQGNPLALVELPAAWSPGGAGGWTAGLAGPDVPLTARLEKAFAGRVSRLDARARDVLLVLAVAHRGDVAEVCAAASLFGTPVDTATLAETTAARLTEPDPAGDGLVRFHHPLVRSGILQAESMARRQAAHAALATALSADRYRRAWHRAMSIIGPDDEVADELATNAELSLARGAASRAMDELERAAQLTTRSSVRGHRLLCAAQHAFSLGQADTVARLVSEASRHQLDELDWARVEWLREIFHDGQPGDAVRVYELCAVAIRAHAAGDTDLALQLLLGAGLRCWWAETGAAARARVAAVLHQLDERDDPRWIAALAVAEPVLAATTVAALLTDGRWDTDGDGDRLRLLGMAAHAIGDTERAADLLDRAQAALRDTGSLGLLPHVLGMYNHVLVELGELAAATVVVAEANRLAEATHQPVWSAGTLSTGGRLAAFQGDPDRALSMAAEATRLAGRLNDQLCAAVLAVGAAHLAARRYVDAYEELARIFDENDPAYHWRESFAGLGILAEAAAASADRVPHARVIVARLEETARVTPASLLHTHLAYARAVLADDDAAEPLYREALARNLTRWPFVRARLEVAYGAWLARQGRNPQARAVLTSAATALERIGAAPWAQRAYEALAAVS